MSKYEYTYNPIDVNKYGLRTYSYILRQAKKNGIKTDNLPPDGVYINKPGKMYLGEKFNSKLYSENYKMDPTFQDYNDLLMNYPQYALERESGTSRLTYNYKINSNINQAENNELSSGKSEPNNVISELDVNTDIIGKNLNIKGGKGTRDSKGASESEEKNERNSENEKVSEGEK